MSRVGVSVHELEGIQRLDKDRQLATYLRAQRANSKHYAAEGKAVVSAWSPLATEDTANKRNIPRSPSPHPEVSAVGFDTPVLKPRTSKLRKKEPTSQNEKREKQQTLERPNTPEPPLEREHTSKPKTDRKSLPKKSTSTKRRAISTSDDEHEARLAGRRERKRAKRAIVKSPDHPLDEAHGEEEPRNKSKRSKAKSKSKNEKAIPGFALMYGLNATNVGSNRLTMKPPINMGVFSKGKASAKITAAKTAKKGQTANLFSEIAFLNKSKQIRQRDNENEHSSSDDDKESLPDDHSTHTAKQLLGKKGLKLSLTKTPVKLRSRSPSCTSSSSDLSGQPLAKGKRCTKRAESIVWDIERDDASTLPTHSPSRDKASIVSGTIIVNARRLQNLNAYEYSRSKQTSPIDVDPEERTAEPDIDAARYQINTAVSRFFGTQPLPLDNYNFRHIARTGSPLSGTLADSQRLAVVPGPAPMEITDNNDLSLSNFKGQTSYDNLPVDIAFPEAYDNEPFDVKGVHSGLSSTQENSFGNVHLRPSVHPSVHFDFYEQLGEEDSLLCVDMLESPSIEIDAAATFYHMDPDRPYTRVPLWCSDFDEEASPVVYGLPLNSDDELTFLDSESMLSIEQPCQDYEDAHWEEDSTTEYIVCDQELLADFKFDATLDNDRGYELDIAPDGGDYDYDDLPFGELSISNDNLDMDCEMLDEEDVSDLSLALTESSIAPQRFHQGRALLLGLSDPGVISPVVLRREAGSRPVSVAEKDVVRGLRGHWQPQRF
ncbi:hypothetical protein BDN71DRAFT_1443248 [Pleurotus eryngii]|uniref:Uncharacterized protein n=1 Tax=Pleurotus eryngii TaxID=5323 RepID=A0A9P6A1W0_PLEER|nr:hypothetical protein BDN71DRAFT_1443248 [Pleurotus eryngii]